jgi:hypothetical protein
MMIWWYGYLMIWWYDDTEHVDEDHCCFEPYK